MFCINCGTHYDLVPVENGKSKYCRICGSVLYKNENNNLVFNTGTLLADNPEIQIQQESEAERTRQEELQKQKELSSARQLESELHREKELALQLQKETLNKEKKLEFEQQREALLKEKEAELAQLREQENESNVSKNSFIKYLVVSLLAISIGAGGYFLINKYILVKPTNSINSSTSDTTTDTLLFSQEKLKTDLAGKDILSWGIVKTNEVASLVILNKNDSAQNTNYTVVTNLDDNNGTKAVAELGLKYNNLVLELAHTNKITYKNTAPVNAWFSFQPVQHCDVFVNTNNKPISIKACSNCAIVKMNTNAENAQKLINHPATIFITSDLKSEALVDFIYVPEK